VKFRLRIVSLTHTLWNSRIDEIRLFVLRGLAGRFLEAFRNSFVDLLVSVVENAAVPLQSVFDAAAAGQQPIEIAADLADFGEG
jgi:hypothetical protein